MAWACAVVPMQEEKKRLAANMAAATAKEEPQGRFSTPHAPVFLLLPAVHAALLPPLRLQGLGAACLGTATTSCRYCCCLRLATREGARPPTLHTPLR